MKLYLFTLLSLTITFNSLNSNEELINFAIGKKATQSSTAFNSPASFGNDQVFANFTHTKKENKPWWQVDLGKHYTIRKIIIWNRTTCCQGRLSNARIMVDGKTVGSIGVAGDMHLFNVNLKGRVIRVQLPKTEYLQISELEVLGPAHESNRIKLSQNKKTSQSSQDYGRPSSNAVNGRFDDITHTKNEKSAWWQVDLGATYSLSEIIVYNRTYCCRERLNHAIILVDGIKIGRIKTAKDQHTFFLNRRGRVVRVQLEGTNFLHLKEVEVFGSK